MAQTQQKTVISLEPVTSSNIAKLGYDLPSKTLRIEFKNGGTYDYANVEHKLYTAFKDNKSLGSFFYKFIRNNKNHKATKL